MRNAGGNLMVGKSVRLTACRNCTPSLIRFCKGMIAPGNQIFLFAARSTTLRATFPPGEGVRLRR